MLQDVYRIGTLMELVRVLALSFADDGKHVKVVLSWLLYGFSIPKYYEASTVFIQFSKPFRFVCKDPWGKVH